MLSWVVKEANWEFFFFQNLKDFQTPRENSVFWGTINDQLNFEIIFAEQLF